MVRVSSLISGVYRVVTDLIRLPSLARLLFYNIEMEIREHPILC